LELRNILGDSHHIKISPDATIGEALVSMVENKTDFLLIDRKGPNDSYGIITRWDLVEGAVANGVDFATTPVLNFARKPLVVMNNLDLDIRWAAKKMANENVSKIAVFDKENFLGFISDVDILKAFSAKSKAEGKSKGEKA
jgi:signal-transduction protein with cAMP-binding, CBS, and nucleotidyltransferase domain